MFKTQETKKMIKYSLEKKYYWMWNWYGLQLKFFSNFELLEEEKMEIIFEPQVSIGMQQKIGTGIGTGSASQLPPLQGSITSLTKN
jgi:hypothetical protein